MPPAALTDFEVNQKKVGTGANQDKVSFNGDGRRVDRQSEDVGAANRRYFGGVRIINFEHAQIAGGNSCSTLQIKAKNEIVLLDIVPLIE